MNLIQNTRMHKPRKPVTTLRDLSARNGDIVCANYVVAVLDVLGQRDAIRRLAKFGPDHAKAPEFIGELRNSIGVRDSVRNAFETLFGGARAFFENFESPNLPERERAAFLRFIQPQISTYAFCDTIVVYSSIASAGGNQRVTDLNIMLMTLSHLLLWAIASGIPIRGAIEFGLGLETVGREIYGPAFLTAYELEQNAAGYPRIVVGPRLLAYLHEKILDCPPSGLVRIVCEQAKECHRYIEQDDDGLFHIDFLGEAIRDTADPETREYFALAQTFVEDEHRRFVEEYDPKLAARYAALGRYFKSKAPAWLSAPVSDGSLTPQARQRPKASTLVAGGQSEPGPRKGDRRNSPTPKGSS